MLSSSAVILNCHFFLSTYLSVFRPYTIQQYKLIKPKDYVEISNIKPGMILHDHCISDNDHQLKGVMMK